MTICILERSRLSAQPWNVVRRIGALRSPARSYRRSWRSSCPREASTRSSGRPVLSCSTPSRHSARRQHSAPRSRDVLSIHRLTAGDGFKYLLKAVASGDVDRRMATPLTAYYTAAGYPAGRWAGSGLTGLGDGRLQPGQEVTEAQMTALFGRAEDPLTGRTLGRPYPVFPSASTRITARVDALEKNLGQTERENAIATIRSEEARRRTKQAVAGFDITFSPVKSVSALWATADVGVQEQIAAAHYRAIDEVIGLIEKHAAFTRTGEAGVAQIDTQGVIATAFDHWDSRGGDPQLHTHLVIANRVQGIDGRWRTLDGRVLSALRSPCLRFTTSCWPTSSPAGSGHSGRFETAGRAAILPSRSRAFPTSSSACSPREPNRSRATSQTCWRSGPLTRHHRGAARCTSFARRRPS
ncbi:conjugative relaxase-like TrwC/TraI family protein [Kribbella orskensis]|uniref:Conjugative relaxase-like TrwC/TraI family protein n=1 Tax=Kribbella orskensis TaxID=2512216 RepID=A0ABY2BHH0_9ACTN|nr:conjugative relaxase-like TrwC/TraI family protein [Kribbella sp. VKM Ac-2500]TCO19597.1 conjugative relaxase-like TrwC/TraI family protein [Kribbella orskensis]